MKYLLLIYNDKTLLDALPDGEYDSRMEHCIGYADELRDKGYLLNSQILEPPAMATTLRVRNGRLSTTDGPFAETKEQLGGFNLIEAKDLNEALSIASKFPWAGTGCVEVRAIAHSEPTHRNHAEPAPVTGQ